MGKREVLSKITFDVKPGEVLMVLGPRGSGKTRLLKALTQVMFPTKGDVFYNNLSLYSAAESERVIPP